MKIPSQKNEQIDVLQSILEPIQKPLDTIDKRFKELVLSENDLIQELIDYVFVKKGKRLRPSLVFITSLIWESPYYDDIIDLALSIELIHIATLAHDDVNDKSEMRRGVPTYNSKWGNTPSVLFGDFLFSRAFVILSKLGNLQIIRNLSKTTSEICEGEIMQSFLKKNYNISNEKYFKIIKYKTASLIAESCRVGAIINNSGENIENHLYQFGFNLGMAFQIYDDYLDFHGDQDKLGKPVMSDIINGYITLPIIHLFNSVSNGQRETIYQTIEESKKEGDLKKINELLFEHKSFDYTLTVAKEYIYKAIKELDYIDQEDIKKPLRQIADFIVNRDF